MSSTAEETMAFLVILGFTFIIIDIVISVFSIGYLASLGVGMIFTGIMVMVELINPNSLAHIAANIGLSSITCVLCSWVAIAQIEKRKEQAKRTINSIAGTEIYLDDDLSVGKPFNQRNLGLNWTIESHDKNYPAGTLVTIKERHADRLIVTKDECESKE